MHVPVRECLALLVFTLGAVVPGRTQGMPPSEAVPVPPCATSGPASVFDCLEAAYSARDVSLIDDLLADDFEFYYASSSESVDREKELEVSEVLFRNEGITSIRLDLDAPEPRALAEKNGWIFERVRVHLALEGQTPSGSKGPFDIEGSATFEIRRMDKPTQHYVISRWIEHRTDE